MDYILIDNFENTRKMMSEKDLRDLYSQLMDELLFNWKDCNDEEILKGLRKEKDEVYTCDIRQVKNAIIDIDGFYEIEEIEVI